MSIKQLEEGLADLAQRAESDHEVQMARADLYKIAKYAIKLHDMLKGVSEAEGLEGWQQAKITKAADYIGSVYHNLDYDMKFNDGELAESKAKASCGCDSSCSHCGGKHTIAEVGKKCECCGNTIKETSSKDSYKESLASMLERKMTRAERSKETKLKKKYDDSEMKANMQKQYGKDWEDVYYATIRKKSMTKGAK